MTADAALDIAALERRRRLSLRAAAIALVVAVTGLPLGLAIGGSDRTDTIGGALIFAAIAGSIACPWIVRAWQSFMRQRMVAAVVSGRPDMRHIDGSKQLNDSRVALASDAFSLAAFRDSGLVEPFESAAVAHVLTGDAQGVPFAIAEIALLDAKGYRMFGGALASFKLSNPRPGLTIVARDRGLLGNLLARAGTVIEPLPLEDPSFEGVFEAYGTDQVGGRVVLTTTMLERLKALDGVAQARGFACAFLDDHLLIAFSGMSWRCPWWRIVKPLTAWLAEYSARINGLVDLPVEIAHTLNLEMPSSDRPPFVPAYRPEVMVSDATGQVFSSTLWRVIGEGGKPLTSVASGAIFGGVALVGAWYGIEQGYSHNLFWYFWGLIAAGVAYGAFAISSGIREIASLAWRFNAPLRGIKRP